jgi:hypothetical protein
LIRTSINLEKTVNHSEHCERCEHCEKATACIILMLHPTGEVRQTRKPRVFVVPAVSPWFELGF